MKKYIILTRKGKLDCRVILDESDLWLGREALDVNNREATKRLVDARAKGESVYEDKNNSVTIKF